MALVHMNFQSQYLGNNTDINIILPDKPWKTDPENFYRSGKKYPVVWLLHGTFGDYTDWIRKSRVELYACERDIIVVMFSGLNANYLNWPNFGMGYDSWDYLFKELMPLIYGWFPASDKREDNFIAGLSMGGGGTIQYAAGHPEKFSAAAVLSSAPRNIHAMNPDGSGDAMGTSRQKNVINAAGGFDNYLNSPANAWDELKSFSTMKDPPRLYFTIGGNDMFKSNFETFKSYSAEIGLNATFEEIPGYSHEWRFWDLTIEKAFDFFGLLKKDAGNPF
jgi:putative tributyrin esterase